MPRRARTDERQLDWVELLKDARSILTECAEFAHGELDGVEDEDLPQRIDALRERIEAAIAEFG